MTEHNFFLPDQAATHKLAAALGQLLQPRDLLALRGDLGAGKTTFARALIQSLNPAEIEVPSPTFTLVQNYSVPQGQLYHFDLYRLGDAQEVLALGWEEARQGIILLEWPERLGTLLPTAHFNLTLMHTETEASRKATLSGPAERLAAVKGWRA